MVMPKKSDEFRAISYLLNFNQLSVQKFWSNLIIKDMARKIIDPKGLGSKHF